MRITTRPNIRNQSVVGTYHRIATGLVFGLLYASQAIGANSAPPPARKETTSPSEATDRRVDQVAASTQALAISRLETMLKRYEGTEQESELRYRLAETYQQNAAIHSRIAYGKASLNNGKPDLTDYHARLDKAAFHWTLFIEKFKSHPELPKAYYFRGKAYEDGEKKRLAKEDYLTLTRKFPSTSEAVSGWMSLAEFAIADNAHVEAIEYLEQIEKRPKAPQFGYALYKLAWSHYNLKHTATALRYGERHISWMRSKIKKNVSTDSPDFTLMETTLIDLTLFYFQGLEEKNIAYDVSGALAYFRKQAPALGQAGHGTSLGRMLIRFGKLLRSREMGEELSAFRRLAFQKISDLPALVDLLLVEFDYHQNRARFASMPPLIHELVSLRTQQPSFDFAKAEKQIAQTAEGLQELVLKNKASSEVRILLTSLTAIYEEWIKLVSLGTPKNPASTAAGSERDPRIERAYHNLAETQFAIGDFAGAVKNYRLIVEGSKAWTKVASEASLRALSAQLEVIKSAKLGADSLSAKRTVSESSRIPLEQPLVQWQTWMVAHRKLSLAPTKEAPNPPNQLAALQALAPFEFELGRILYSRGYYDQGISLFSRLVDEFPASEQAPAAAALLIDDALERKDWEAARRIALRYLREDRYQALVQSAARAEFRKQLIKGASEATFKLIELKHAAKAYDEVRKLAGDFKSLSEASPRAAEVQLILGFALEALGDRQGARQEWGALLEGELVEGAKPLVAGLTPVIRATALVARARLSESEFDLESAERDWKRYTLLGEVTKNIPGAPKLLAVRGKLILLAWLNGRPGQHCGSSDLDEAATELCDGLKAIAKIRSYSEADGATLSDAIDQMRKSKTNARAIFAMLALNSSSKENPLDYRDRLEAFKLIAKHTHQLDRLLLATLSPWVQKEYPHWIRRARELMNKVTPITANPKSIERRVAGIQELEATLTRLAKLPWAEVRVATLIESAESYSSLVRDLMAVPAPAEVRSDPAALSAYQESMRRLTLPFEEKAQEIRSVAFKMGSEAGISEERWSPFAAEYFAQNPSQAKELKTRFTLQPDSMRVRLERLQALDPDFRWDSKNPWGQTFQKALEADPTPENVSRMAALLQIAAEKAILPPGVLAFSRALFWQKTGASAEALAELRDGRFSMSPSLKSYANWILFQNALRTSAPDLAVQYLRDYDPRPLPTLPSGKSATVILR